MRFKPPHRFIRFRGVLLAVAVLALVVATSVLLIWKYDPPLPQYAKTLLALGSIAFLWCNGAFWWLELRYPHVQIAPDTYVSRTEQGSKFGQIYSLFFFGAYGLAALFGTFSLLQGTVGG